MRTLVYWTARAAIVLSVAAVSITGNNAVAWAASQTAQSAMVDVSLDSANYVIDEKITWTFHGDTAAQYFTNLWDEAAPVVTCTGSGCAPGNTTWIPNSCPTPTAPLAPPIPIADKVWDSHGGQNDVVGKNACTFFAGGALEGDSYTQSVTVNGDCSVCEPCNAGSGCGTNVACPTIGTQKYRLVSKNANFKFEYTYNLTPTTDVDPHTAWTSVEENGTVDIGFSGFVVSESFLKQTSPTRNKYSFTMIDGGVTRARNVFATLQQSDGNGGWTDSASINLNDLDLDTDTVNDALSITPATVDFEYYANAGVFGNSAVYGALHAPDGKAPNFVVGILKGTPNGPGEPEFTYTDNFAGNNNDLASGAVHLGLFGDAFAGLTEAGTFQIVVTGNLKENGANRLLPFSVTSNTINIGIGSCNNPNQ